MATTTKLVASNAFYGNSGNAAFTNSAAKHMYVGKYGTPVFRSRMTFPALGSAADLGTARIAITKAVLYIRRNDGGPATVTAGCSSSSAWNTSLAATGAASHGDSTGWKQIDVTACADAIAGYTGNWYMHLRSGDYIRYNGTGSDWKPYLMVTWEYVAATITGDKDDVTLGSPVTFTIAPEVGGETHTLTYRIGDTSGTIVTEGGNSITWTPPVSLAAELPDDDTGMVEIRLTAYDADGNVQRTERYYQTVTVPEDVKPVVSQIGAALKNGLGGYGLTGRSYLTIAPVIDMNGAYGADIVSVTAQVNGQSIAWTTLTETGAGIFTGAAANSALFAAAGTYALVLTVTDSRGRTATATRSFTACAYAIPVISGFSVERYEPVYDANEEIVGYQASDLGGYVWLNLNANVKPVNPAGTQLNTLRWSVQAVNAASGDAFTISGTGAQSASIVNDRTKFSSPVDESETWNYTLTVTDTAGCSAVQYSTVVPARVNFALARSKYGAAFGGIPRGTQANPLLESYYPVHGYVGLFGSDGNRIDRIAKTEFLTISSEYFTTYNAQHGVDVSVEDLRPRVSRVGPLVFLDGMLSNNVAGVLNADGVDVATLPEWARPVTDIYALHQGSSAAVWWLRIKASGVVNFSRCRATDSVSYDSFAAGRQFPITACWIAADAFL